MGNAVPKKKPAAGAAGALVPVDPTDDVDVAIAAFVRGFAFTHSFTHPYVAERVGPLWVMRDAPRNRPGACYRREDWVARGVDPAEVDRTARLHTCQGAVS